MVNLTEKELTPNPMGLVTKALGTMTSPTASELKSSLMAIVTKDNISTEINTVMANNTVQTEVSTKENSETILLKEKERLFGQINDNTKVIL